MAQAKNGHPPSVGPTNDQLGASDTALFALPTASPDAKLASPGIGPLDLAALGEFVFTGSSGVNTESGTLVVKSPSSFSGGNIAFVNLTQEANGSYVVSSGTFPSSSGVSSKGSHGGATYDLYSPNALQLDFQPDKADPGHYQLSMISSLISKHSAALAGYFGEVDVLGWNSNSILLSAASYGNLTDTGPAVDIVLSTSDMSGLPGSLPANTSFTTTGPAPTVLGVKVPEIPCFVAGTRLATPNGDCAVETLKAGDLVLTQDGQALPIEWAGSRRVYCNRHPRPARVWPVRVRRDAFGPAQPAHDLLLSPDHSIYLGGVLIPICELIDGILIVQEKVATVHYHHVQLAMHDILLAHGMPVESLLDPASRSQFDDEPVGGHLHPDFAATAFAWEAACAPIKLWGPEVDSARALLAERAGTLRAAA